MPIKFQCVYCEKLLRIAERRAGAAIKCPNCSRQLIVPTATEKSVRKEPKEPSDQLHNRPDPTQSAATNEPAPWWSEEGVTLKSPDSIWRGPEKKPSSNPRPETRTPDPQEAGNAEATIGKGGPIQTAAEGAQQASSWFHRPRLWMVGLLAAIPIVFMVVVVITAVVLLKPGPKPVAKTEPAAAPEAPKPLSPEELYALASPGVVTVIVKNEYGEEIGTGSGFFIAEQLVQDELGKIMLRLAEVPLDDGRQVRSGYIVTNHHVIKSAVDAEILLLDGSKGKVEDIVTEDELADLVVLSVLVYSHGALTRLHLAEHLPPIGASVFAIGSPRGLANTLSPGLISGLREIKPGVSWLQTSAPISPGSSGGPLLTSDGRVAGVTTGGFRDGQNLNFAVSVSELRRLLSQPCKRRGLSNDRSLRRCEDDAFSKLVWHVLSKGKDISDYGKNQQVLAQKYKELGILKAREQIANESYDEAIKTLEAAKPFVPGEFAYLWHFLNAEAHLYLATDEHRYPRGKSLDETRTAFRNGLHGRTSLDSLMQARKLKPMFGPTLQQLHVFHYNAGEWEKALLAADALVKVMPQNGSAYYSRGECHLALSKFEAALADFRESQRINPKHSSTSFGIARVWLSLDENEKAIESFRSALALNYSPASSCHFYIGESYLRLRKYQQAILAYEKARTDGYSPSLVNERIALCRKFVQ